jgi:hypothetical protein
VPGRVAPDCSAVLVHDLRFVFDKDNKGDCPNSAGRLEQPANYG